MSAKPSSLRSLVIQRKTRQPALYCICSHTCLYLIVLKSLVTGEREDRKKSAHTHRLAGSRKKKEITLRSPVYACTFLIALFALLQWHRCKRYPQPLVLSLFMQKSTPSASCTDPFDARLKVTDCLFDTQALKKSRQTITDMCTRLKPSLVIPLSCCKQGTGIR